MIIHLRKSLYYLLRILIKIFFFFLIKFLNFILIILGKISLVLLMLLKIVILAIVGIYFGVKQITPNFPFLRKFSKIKFTKYLHKLLPKTKTKINLVFDLDGTLIKSTKINSKNQKQF